MRYAPIEDHGVIGDLHTIALVATDGNIDWFCPGRFDAPSVFGGILDADRGGRFQIGPEDEPGNVKQLYLPDTNVLITRFLTPHGVGEVQDFMPVRNGNRGDAPQRIVRRVLCVRGEMRFRLDCEPRFDYGRTQHTIATTDAGAVFATPQMALTLSSTEQLMVDGGDVHCVFTLAAGDVQTFVLEVAPVGAMPPETWRDGAVQQLFEETVDFWRTWIAGCTYRGRWRETVRR